MFIVVENIDRILIYSSNNAKLQAIRVNEATFLSDKHDLLLLTIHPLFENTLSDGTEVAVTHRNLLANFAILGYLL